MSEHNTSKRRELLEKQTELQKEVDRLGKQLHTAHVKLLTLGFVPEAGYIDNTAKLTAPISPTRVVPALHNGSPEKATEQDATRYKAMTQTDLEDRIVELEKSLRESTRRNQGLHKKIKAMQEAHEVSPLKCAKCKARALAEEIRREEAAERGTAVFGVSAAVGGEDATADTTADYTATGYYDATQQWGASGDTAQEYGGGAAALLVSTRTRSNTRFRVYEGARFVSFEKTQKTQQQCITNVKGTTKSSLKHLNSGDLLALNYVQNVVLVLVDEYSLRVEKAPIGAPLLTKPSDVLATL